MTTDKDREEARKFIRQLEDESNKIANELFVMDVFSRIRSAAKAGALAEAAENAVDWVHQEFPKQDDPARQQAIDDSLRAAVLADEFCDKPAKTREEWAKKTIAPLKHWIETKHGDLPASRLTGDEIMEVYAILADEPNKENQ